MHEEAGLKFNIQKTKIMASGAIFSWQLEGRKVETVTDFIFLGSKIIVDSEYSHQTERRLLLGRKAITKVLELQLQHQSFQSIFRADFLYD